MTERNAVRLVFLTALISGFSVFLNKFALATIDPTLFTFLKNALVGLFLIGGLIVAREWTHVRALTRGQWIQLLLIGLVGGAIPFVLFFQGLSIASAASGAFVQKTLFLFSSVLAVILLKEKANWRTVAGAALLLVGNYFLLKLQSISFGEGEILILAATLFWALENVLAKRALQELSGTLVAGFRMLFGGGFILLFLAFTGGLAGITTLSANAWLWVLFTATLLGGYVYTYYNGLKHLPVSVATSILLLGSPITTLLQTLVNGTPITVGQVAGIVIVTAGVGVFLHAFGLSAPFREGVRSHTHNES